MNRNIWVLIITSSIFSICFGIYDFVLPIYLKQINVSYENMAWIFGISAILIFFLRMYVGAHSDIIGRKLFYSSGLLISSISNLLTPAFPSIIPLTVLKTLREASTLVRDTMRSILVFENAKDKFLRFISRFVGLEFFLQGAGTLIAGLLIPSTAFYSCGILLFLATILFSQAYKEKFIPAKRSGSSLQLKEIFKINLPPKLKIIAFASFVFTIGLNISHSFIMPLFFMVKFNATPVEAAVILMIHRMSLGIPMFVYGNFLKGNLKLIYIVTILYEGLSIGISAIIPDFWIATIIWLTHDIFGAAFWLPVQNTFIQQYAREESRGKDTSEVVALSSLGAVIAPFIAGALAPIDISLPFLASGIAVFLSAFILLKL